MGDYKIGKDIGSLSARVKALEEKYQRPVCITSGPSSGGYSTVSDADLFESLKNGAPDEKTFTILKSLVTLAGDVTIRDLFAATRDDVGDAAADAIKMAKQIGFLELSNDKCCTELDDPFKDDFCKRKKGKWCTLVKKETKYRCTLASDDC